MLAHAEIACQAEYTLHRPVDTAHISALRAKEAKEDTQSRTTSGKSGSKMSSVTSFARNGTKRAVPTKSASAPALYGKNGNSSKTSRVSIGAARSASFAKSK